MLNFLTLASGIIIILFSFGFIYRIIFKEKLKNSESFTKILKNNYFILSLMVSLTATLGSLFYSEIMGFSPCILCWFQRIFMYPQVFLFSLALWKKDFAVIKYSMALSVVGALISFYHYLLQIGFLKESVVCSVVGYSVSCPESFFTNYGYITIPVMTLIAFILLIILGILNFKK